MAVSTTVTVTRPNESTQWWWEACDSTELATFKAYRKQNFEDNGKYVSNNMTLSGDKLTYTITKQFDTPDNFEAWLADSTHDAWKEKRDTYEAANNITRTRVSKNLDA